MLKLYTYHPRLHTRGHLKPAHLEDVVAMDAHVFALAHPCDEIAVKLGDHYHRRLIADGRVDQHVWDIVQDALTVWNGGGTVIFHCHAGRNRATFLAGLTLRQITGWSGPQVVEHVQHVRPNALANPHFLEYLQGLT